MVYRFTDVVIDSRTGLNPRKNFVLGSGDNYYITIKDIYNGKVNLTDKTDKVDDEAIQIIKRRSRIKVGDVLFVSIGRIGETAIVMNKDDSWDVNESVFVFTLNNKIITPEYFCTMFQSQGVKQYLSGNSSGSTFKSIKMNQLEQITFDLPPVTTQKSITTKLTAVRRIIDLRTSQLAELDNLVKARFVEMFSSCQHIASMNELCSIITDGTHQPPKFQDNGIPFIFVSNLVNNTVTYNAEKFISEETYGELYKRTPIEIGDLLLSTVGSYGHVAVVVEDKKFLFQRHIAYLKPKHEIVNSFYLHAALLSPDGQRQIEEKAKGIAQKTLNLSEIKTILIPLPSIEEQKNFEVFVKQVDKSKVAVQTALRKKGII